MGFTSKLSLEKATQWTIALAAGFTRFRAGDPIIRIMGGTRAILSWEFRSDSAGEQRIFFNGVPESFETSVDFSSGPAYAILIVTYRASTLNLYIGNNLVFSKAGVILELDGTATVAVGDESTNGSISEMRVYKVFANAESVAFIVDDLSNKVCAVHRQEIRGDVAGPIAFTVTPASRFEFATLPLANTSFDEDVYVSVMRVDAGSVIPTTTHSFSYGSRSYTRLDELPPITLEPDLSYSLRIVTTDATAGFALAAWGLAEGSTVVISEFNDFPLSTSGEQFVAEMTTFATTTEDAPFLRPETSLKSAFAGAASLPASLGSWDMSQVVSLEETFFGATAPIANDALSNWDVSNVLSFRGTFRNYANFNGAILGWDLSSAIDMSDMFNGATQFNFGF
jgi:hypothetical protein